MWTHQNASHSRGTCWASISLLGLKKNGTYNDIYKIFTYKISAQKSFEFGKVFL